MTGKRINHRTAGIARGTRGRRRKLSPLLQAAVDELVSAYHLHEEVEAFLHRTGVLLYEQEGEYLLDDEGFCIEALGPLYVEAALNGTKAPAHDTPMAVSVDSLPSEADETSRAWQRLKFFSTVGSALCAFVLYWLTASDGEGCIIVNCTPGSYGQPWPPAWIGPFANVTEFTGSLPRAGWWVCQKNLLSSDDFKRTNPEEIQRHLSDLRLLLGRAEPGSEPWKPVRDLEGRTFRIHEDQVSWDG